MYKKLYFDNIEEELKKLNYTSKGDYYIYSKLENKSLPLILEIKGNNKTPYEGGVFFLEADFPDNYPTAGPKIKFLTKIFHCNVFDWGICISTLNNWVPTPMDKVIADIFQLFYVNNPDNNGQPSQEYKNNRPLFEKHCREWVQLYAK